MVLAMSTPTILIVIPTYGQFDYAVEAVRSAMDSTRLLDPHVAIVDDASPDWGDYIGESSFQRFMQGVKDLNVLHDDRVTLHQFAENGGLTRSWNSGLTVARDANHDFCCVTNSDVVFAKGWDYEIFKALHFHKKDLVGPLTNAPGTNHGQYVGNYSNVYKAKKPADKIDEIQEELGRRFPSKFQPTTLNGFCLVAKTATWWDNAYDAEHVFRPRNDFNSRGQPNPTPLMTLNEYELQTRWHRVGLNSVCCLGSYVFHYRAVTRGEKHKKGDWTRKA